MSTRNCGETIVEGLREVVETLAPRARPSRESANGRQHVVDAMLEFVPEYPLMLRALRQSGLGIHTLDRRGQQIGIILEEIDVVLRKTAKSARVDFQDAER